MATSKPTILVIPGAWHVPAHYELLTADLQRAGYPMECIKCPSTGSKNLKSIDITMDAAHLRDQALLPLLDNGKDVVVVAHSYGGFVGSTVAKGLSKREREAAGKKGGVVGLVWMTAFIPKEGQSLMDIVGQTFPSWITVNEEDRTLGLINQKEFLYHDVDEATASKAVAELQLHSLLAQTSPSGPPAWQDTVFEGRRGYIIATEDAAIPDFIQRGMIEASGVKWATKDLATSHSPFLSKPKETAEAVVELIGGFA